MSKVITFSTKFPAYHQNAGQPTLFVEKLLKSLYPDTTYFMAICKDCGYQGVSCTLQDGSPIADTGDFDDPSCPKCCGENIQDHPSIDMGYYLERDDVFAKGHTIRAGKRFKPGDKFSPRMWSGVPYNSKQLILAPDIEVVKTWDFGIDSNTNIYIRNVKTHMSNGQADLKKVASNDGLSVDDFLSWFKYPKPFEGQIICWDTKIEY